MTRLIPLPQPRSGSNQDHYQFHRYLRTWWDSYTAWYPPKRVLLSKADFVPAER